MSRRVAAILVVLVVANVFTAGAQGVKSQWSGVYTAEQAERGRVLYVEQCSACHRTNLRGYAEDGIAAPELYGEEFEAFWGDYTVGDLFDKIQKGEPQDDPGALKPTEYADILAFMFSVAKYPRGTTDLPSDSETLKQYKFLKTKPAGR